MSEAVLEKSKNNIFENILVFLSFLLFTAIITAFLSPIIITNADDSMSAIVRTNVEPTASLTLDTNSLDFDILPTTDGTFESKQVNATVETNSTGGYELYFSSEDNETNMVSDRSNATIPSNFNNTVTSATMESNQWGYSLNNTDFLKIPALNSQAKIKDVPHFPSAQEKGTAVYVGIKISSSLTAGDYTKTLRFSAVAHESLDTRTIFDIANMQDMLSVVCTNTTTPATSATIFDWDGSHDGDSNYIPRTVLTDKRDGNRYLISKLADGNCWMSQSLALDLSVYKTLTNADTNLTTKNTWIPENSTQTTVGTTWEINGSNGARSYHPRANEAYYRGGINASSSPTGVGDEYLWEKTGNFYNWYAATAGSGTSDLLNSTVNDSICPRGWRLPPLDGNRSYHNLLSTTYEISADETGSLMARTDPFNFTLSGGYSYDGSNVYDQSVDGKYWSATTTNITGNASYFALPRTSVYTHHSAAQGYGFSIRCVASN